MEREGETEGESGGTRKGWEEGRAGRWRHKREGWEGKGGKGKTLTRFFRNPESLLYMQVEPVPETPILDKRLETVATDLSFSFAHDRIQQAAYILLPREKAMVILLRNSEFFYRS
jgi:hypothetical protein